MKTSESINELAKAMSLAQKAMKPAAKDALNPHFKSKYSNIAAVWEAMRQPLGANELTVWQDVTTESHFVSVTTRIVHSSGQWVEFGPLALPLAKFDPQGIGSGTSYAKRYALCAAIGIVSDEEDDDGEKAQARNYQQQQPKPVVKPSAQQVSELEIILRECPMEFQDSVKATMAKRNWAGISHMDMESYVKLRGNSVKERDAYQKAVEEEMAVTE